MIVVDASMAIAWQFEDEATPSTDTVLRLTMREGAIVPTIWCLEVANVLRMAVRKRRCTEDFFEAAISRLRNLPIHEDGETSDHAWSRTSTLARDEPLTLYDAAYLELAMRVKLPLATCDKALIDAANRHGVTVLAP